MIMMITMASASMKFSPSWLFPSEMQTMSSCCFPNIFRTWRT